MLVSGFDEREVILGQGNITLEILNVLPDLDIILEPIGSCGLTDWIALIIKEQKLNVKIIDVQSEESHAMHRAWQINILVEMNSIFLLLQV